MNRARRLLAAKKGDDRREHGCNRWRHSETRPNHQRKHHEDDQQIRDALEVIRYKPKFSVSWDGNRVSYYEHKDKKFTPLRQIISLCFEWLFFWCRFWVVFPVKVGWRLTLRVTRTLDS